jgi:hypothetical protein
LLRQVDDLVDLCGEEGAERVGNRAAAAMREIYGGDAPPPFANYDRDPWYVVEADMLAEQFVAESRSRGVGRSSDPDWCEKLNVEANRRIDEHYDRLEKRAAPKKRVAPPAPAPTPEPAQLEELVGAAVEKALATRAQTLVQTDDLRAVTRSALLDMGCEVLADAHQGVWQQREYRRGQTVTYNGCWWLAVETTRHEPGSAGHLHWRLLAKQGRNGRDRR